MTDADIVLVHPSALTDRAPYAYAAVSGPGRTIHTAGAGLWHVVRSTVCVASDPREDFGTAWEVLRAALSDHDAPSALLGVTVLGYEDQLVEVDTIAVVGAGEPAVSSVTPRPDGGRERPRGGPRGRAWSG